MIALSRTMNQAPEASEIGIHRSLIGMPTARIRTRHGRTDDQGIDQRVPMVGHEDDGSLRRDTFQPHDLDVTVVPAQTERCDAAQELVQHDVSRRRPAG